MQVPGRDTGIQDRVGIVVRAVAEEAKRQEDEAAQEEEYSNCATIGQAMTPRIRSYLESGLRLILSLPAIPSSYFFFGDANLIGVAFSD